MFFIFSKNELKMVRNGVKLLYRRKEAVRWIPLRSCLVFWLELLATFGPEKSQDNQTREAALGTTIQGLSFLHFTTNKRSDIIISRGDNNARAYC